MWGRRQGTGKERNEVKKRNGKQNGQHCHLVMWKENFKDRKERKFKGYKWHKGKKGNYGSRELRNREKMRGYTKNEKMEQWKYDFMVSGTNKTFTLWEKEALFRYSYGVNLSFQLEKYSRIQSVVRREKIYLLNILPSDLKDIISSDTADWEKKGEKVKCIGKKICDEGKEKRRRRCMARNSSPRNMVVMATFHELMPNFSTQIHR